MKTVNKVTLLLFMLIWQTNVFSQFADLPIRNQEDYRLLDEEIQKALKKSKCFSHNDTTLRLFTVFTLRTTDTITKEEYADGSFLKKLKYYYFYDYKNRNKSFTPPKDSIVVADNIYVYRANGGGFFSYDCMRFFRYTQRFSYNKTLQMERYKWNDILMKKLSANYPEEFREIKKNYSNNFFGSFLELKEYMWDKGNFFIFRLYEKKYDVFFIINEQLEIFVFFSEHNLLPIKEFIELHWEQFSREEGIWLNR